MSICSLRRSLRSDGRQLSSSSPHSAHISSQDALPLLSVEGQKDGNFKRSGLRKLEYDPYTPEMRKMISGYIRTVDAALKLRNLSGVPDDYYPR